MVPHSLPIGAHLATPRFGFVHHGIYAGDSVVHSPGFKTLFHRGPQVFATGFLVGLLEWACIEALKPHLDWPREQTVGTHIDVSHCAATPPGVEIRVQVKLVQVHGRRLVFEVQAHDRVELISKGTHERFVIDRARFSEKVKEKLVT